MGKLKATVCPVSPYALLAIWCTLTSYSTEARIPEERGRCNSALILRH